MIRGVRSGIMCVAFLAALGFWANESSLAQSGGGYAVTRSTISGGSGRVAGGAYEIGGTFGQHDAGESSGGGYRIIGGFWPPAECPGSSAPKLQTQFQIAAGVGVPEPKMRVLAVTAGDVGQTQSIRVTWNSQANWPGGYTALEGQKMYMTEPFQVCENSGQGSGVSPPACGIAPGLPQRWFWASELTCNEALVWFGDLTELVNYCTGSGEACSVDADCAQGTCGVDGVIHLYSGAIGPSRVSAGVMIEPAEYSVQVFKESCPLDLETSYSVPLVTRTSGWGDLVGAGAPGCPVNVPNHSADLIPDVTTAIDKFSNNQCAPKKTRVDVDHDFVISFPTDILSVLNAFSNGGGGFSEAAPAACPAAAEEARVQEQAQRVRIVRIPARENDR